jgi:hypothetical protein
VSALADAQPKEEETMGLQLTRRVIHAWLLCGAALLAACGGGSGGGGGSEPPAAATAPTLSAPPASVSVAVGQAATFSVTATGSAPLSYQWLRDGVAIAGATGDSYSIGAAALGDNAARFSAVVSNATGSATSGDAVLTVTGGGPGAGAFGRYVPAWSSMDSSPVTGTYTLGLVDPDSAAPPVPVDQLVASTNSNSILRIRGGAIDAATGHVLDPAVRNLVYLKAGSLYRLNLDKGAGIPAPQRISTETQATLPWIVAVSDSGDDALISYFEAGNSNAVRYVGLRSSSGTAPRSAPQRPGDLFPGSLRGWATDPATGQITTLYWVYSGTIYSTDSQFGNRADIVTYGSGIAAPWNGVGFQTGGRMGRGLFFFADGSLRRLDFRSGTIREVHAGVRVTATNGVVDDTHGYVLALTASDVQLLRVADDDTTPAQVIASGASLLGLPRINLQTRDHLIFITGAVGQNATSIRKADGVITRLPAAAPTPTGSFIWDLDGLHGGTVGDRVYYSNGTSVGSVKGDGTDRREFSGAFNLTRMLPATIAPHRLHWAETGLPAAKVLLWRGSTFAWLDLATGELGATVGTGSVELGLTAAPYRDLMPGRATTINDDAFVAAGATLRLDSYFLTDQADSLLRLTNNIP